MVLDMHMTSLDVFLLFLDLFSSDGKIDIKMLTLWHTARPALPG